MYGRRPIKDGHHQRLLFRSFLYQLNDELGELTGPKFKALPEFWRLKGREFIGEALRHPNPNLCDLMLSYINRRDSLIGTYLLLIDCYEIMIKPKLNYCHRCPLMDEMIKKHKPFVSTMRNQRHHTYMAFPNYGDAIDGIRKFLDDCENVISIITRYINAMDRIYLYDRITHSFN